MRAYEDIEWSLMEGNTSKAAEQTEKTKNWKWKIEWIELLARLRKFGFNDIFFREMVRQSKVNPSRGAIELKMPPLSYLYDFEQQVFVLDDLVNEDTVETLAYFQGNLSTFTMNLVKAEEGDDFNYLYQNIKPFTETASKLIALKDLHMPWLTRYLQTLLNSLVDPQMQLYVQSVKYLHRIYSFLSEYDNDLLCDYIQMKFLIYLMKYDRIHLQPDSVRNIRENFPLILQWLHGSLHPEVKEDIPVIQQLFANLKLKFHQNIKENSAQLPAATVDHMLKKLDSLQLVIFDKSTQEVELYYQHLHFLASEYYGNRLRLNRFKFNIHHSTLTNTYRRDSLQYLDSRTPVGEGDKKWYPYHLPFLYPQLNIVYMPLTLLQEPFYKNGMDETLIYSSLGYFLAHEITKAFDSRHIHIDGNGVYKDLMSVVKADSEEDDFEKTPVVDDLAGLKLAYNTFATHHSKLLSQTVLLRNVAYTKEKVFFLHYAQLFCSPLCGYHPMADFYSYDACARVNTPTKHSETFRRVFGCPSLSTEEKEVFALWPSQDGEK
ncbi:membrane metallo-endopeptidase-like 1 [Stomoxys calcitrans]|uniref:membrane metallo-endopeptidase-like 1 n=1 Tax=Stomoxys calcitrans TaxID=35570 RepID=UPI0027E39299|nr:membrane metallo-endopeptidase-like 1 [Stomoxys calcitrans]XP_013111101.2 membrane metallo-endopeptidase-like 1 [Stomoxys calcitrans]